MKFLIDKANFMKALAQVAPVAATNNHLPILSHVRLVTGVHSLSIEANNLETAVALDTELSTDSDGGTNEPGTICAPAQRLASVVRACPNGQISCELGEHYRLSVQCGSASFKLACLDAADWPAMPDVPTDTQGTSCEPDTLADTIERASYAASGDEARFNLNAINIEPQDKGVRLTTTDGHRLARAELGIVIDFSGARKSALLPKTAAAHLVKLLRSGGERAQLTLDDKNLFIQFGHARASFRLVDGEYPNADAVIPGGDWIEIEAGRVALLDAINRANLFTSERNMGLNVAISAGQITIASQSGETGEGSDSVAIAYEGEPIGFIVNGFYFADALRHVSTDTVRLQFVDGDREGRPFIIRPTGGDDYFGLVMPMRK